MCVWWQVLTMDSWTEPMYSLSVAWPTGSPTYFVIFCILGGFFVVNLFLAVIFEEFLSAQQLNDAKEAMEKKAQEAKDDAALLESGGGGKPAADSGSDSAALLANGHESSDGGNGGGGGGCCDCPAAPGGCRAAVREVALSNWLNTLSTVLVVVNMVCHAAASEA